MECVPAARFAGVSAEVPADMEAVPNTAGPSENWICPAVAVAADWASS